MANTLEIIVKATDKASGTLKGITKGLDSFHSANAKTLKLLSKIGKATAVALTAAATSAIAMGADMVKTAISVKRLCGVTKTTRSNRRLWQQCRGLALKSALATWPDRFAAKSDAHWRVGLMALARTRD